MSATRLKSCKLLQGYKLLLFLCILVFFTQLYLGLSFYKYYDVKDNHKQILRPLNSEEQRFKLQAHDHHDHIGQVERETEGKNRKKLPRLYKDEQGVQVRFTVEEPYWTTQTNEQEWEPDAMRKEVSKA